MLTKSSKRFSLIFPAILSIALVFALFSFAQNWISIQSSFGQLNTINIPTLERAAAATLHVSQARTELYRYIQGYEQMPFRMEKHLKALKTILQWLSQNSFPEKNKALFKDLLAGTIQFQNSLDQLQLHTDKKNSVQIALTTNTLIGHAATLASLSIKLHDTITEQILYENNQIKSLISQNYAILSGISLAASLLIIGGLLFYNRSLKKQVRANTVDLQNRVHELKISKERLRVAGKVSYDLIYEWNVATDRLEWYGDIDRLLGYEKGEIANTINAWLHLVHPDDVDHLADAVESHRKSTRPIRYDYRVKHKNGSYRHWRNHGSPLLDDQGYPYKWIGVSTDVTERIQTEAALKQSEAKFRELADLLPQVIFEIDAEARVTYVNQAGFQNFNYTFKEFKAGLNAMDMIVPEDRNRAIKNLANTISSGGISQYEYVMQRKDGTAFPAIIYSSPICHDGKTEGIRGIITDISERKNYEKKIRQRLIALTQPDVDIKDLELTDIIEVDLLQSLQDGFAEAFMTPSLIYDTQGRPITKPSRFSTFCRIVRGTKKGAADCKYLDGQLMRELRKNHLPLARHGCVLNNIMTGAVPIVIQGRHLANWGIGQMVHGELDMDKIRQYAMDIGLNEEDLIAAAKTLVPVDDQTFDRSIKFLNILAGHVGLLALQNVQQGRDIAIRKKTETERDHLMSAINQTKESIVITDHKARIQYVNPAFEHITGYTREEVIGQNPRILQSGEHDAAFYKEMWRTLARGESWAGQLINKRKDGSLFTEEATLAPVYDNSGKIVNYVAVKRDVGQAIQLEKEKNQLEEQYRQAQKVESIGRLAGGVAHDLNNLLSPILGYAEILLDDLGNDEDRRNKVDQILRAGFRARDLVRQLLAFSRKQALQLKTVSINKIITDFEKLLRRTIPEDIEIELDLSPDPIMIRADIGQIEQILMNLSVNSADSMPDGGKLTIETTRMDLDEKYAKTHQAVKPGTYLLLAVSDTGSGMDDEIRNNVFEPFFSTKGESGTGLGLATVYGIVKQHGGNIWIYSEPDNGTTFKIYLPVCDVADIKEATGKKELSDLTGAETILLAEDNAQVRDLAHTILIRQGYTVLTAKNGKDALSILKSHDGPLQLLLTDVIMPEMNGNDLFASVSERHPGLKVLYMSGYTGNVIAHRGILSKGVNFIQKPFSINALAVKVREVLDQGGGLP